MFALVSGSHCFSVVYTCPYNNLSTFLLIYPSYYKEAGINMLYMHFMYTFYKLYIYFITVYIYFIIYYFHLTNWRWKKKQILKNMFFSTPTISNVIILNNNKVWNEHRCKFMIRTTLYRTINSTMYHRKVLLSSFHLNGHMLGFYYIYFIYGLETVVSVLFPNTRTRWLYNEREIFNTARGLLRPSAVLKISSSLYSQQVRKFVNKTRTNSL